MAVPKRKMSRRRPARGSRRTCARPRRRTRCARTAAHRGSRTRCAATAVGTEDGRSSTSSDPMGADGDQRVRAPVGSRSTRWAATARRRTIVAGGVRGRRASTSTFSSSGRPDRSAPHLPAGGATAARRGAAGARSCRDGRRAGVGGPHQEGFVARPLARKRSATAGPQAMVGAGNTGATMAAALLRMGRIHGVHRPAIAVPCRCPGADRRSCSSTAARPSIPNRMARRVGACSPARTPRFASASTSPRSGCCRTARSRARATTCARPRAPLLARRKGFVGNVEGRDLLRASADVIVTDGFTGNVALKTARRRAGRARGPRVRRARRARVRRRWPTRSSCACSKPPRRCCPTTPAARCCSASTACASSRTARRRRPRS